MLRSSLISMLPVHMAKPMYKFIKFEKYCQVLISRQSHITTFDNILHLKEQIFNVKKRRCSALHLLFHYILNAIIISIPNSKTVAIFKVIFSLNNVKPKAVVSKIVEMFCKGKNTVLSIFPAKIVFNKLAPPKQKPIKTDGVTDFILNLFLLEHSN